MKFRPNCPRAHDAPYERSIPNRRSRFGYEYANQSPVRPPLPIFSEIPPMPFTKWDDDLGMTALGAQRKHVTLSTDFRSRSQNGHSRYGHPTARFAPKLPSHRQRKSSQWGGFRSF